MTCFWNFNRYFGLWRIRGMDWWISTCRNI